MAIRAESVTHERFIDEPRRGPLGPLLSQVLVEQVLDRSDARRPVRSFTAATPALAVAVTPRAIDLGAGQLAIDALHEVASLAIAHFLDHGFLAVVRPDQGPTFLHPLPPPDDSLDEVAALCRQMDEEQVRAHVVATAGRFRHATERGPTMRELIVEVRLGEGTLVGPPGFLGLLVAGASWRPV